MLNTKLFSILCIILSFFILPALATAQSATVTGRISDPDAKPVALANVFLLNSSDTSLIATALSAEDGSFSLETAKAGRFFVRITAINFKTMLTPSFELISSAEKELGNIQMERDTRILQEVSVKSLQPTITQLPDRMVVNVQGTAMAAGNTAFDVLGRAPGVFIDHDGNIQLNGRAGVLVMIDGRQTWMSARDLRTFLEGMSAENIKNIEVITNPSSKYEAEGSSGIININLKKSTRTGMNGSAYASLNYNGTDWGNSVGGTLNYKAGKWNSSLMIDRQRRVGGREASFTRVFLTPGETTYFDQQATGAYRNYGPPTGRFSTDYTINERHSVGGMISIFRLKGNNEFLAETFMGPDPKQPNLFIKADNFQSFKYRNYTGNFHYAFKIDTIGSMLTIDLDRANMKTVGEANFYNYYDSLDNGRSWSDILYTYTPSGYDIYTGRIDFIRQWNATRKFEAGLRASDVESDNDFRFYFNNGALVLDPLRTNHFRYREKIYAAYINYVANLGKKTTLQAGLRAEHTRSLGDLITTGQRTKRRYTDLFPSVFIQQKLHDNYNITWRYSRRIQRPNYGNLNPFRAYRDPYTYSEGNPFIRPQYTHAFSIAQTFYKLYTLTLFYNLNKDMMAELPKIDVANATTIYYQGNVDNAYSLGGNATIPVRFSKNWESQNTLVMLYNYNEIKVDQQPIKNSQLYYSVQSSHTIVLPANFKLEASFLYQGPAAFGLYAIAPRWRFDAGLRKSLFNKKLEVILNAVDIFKTQRLKFKTHINGNINDFDQYMRARVVGLTVRYNFSKGLKVEAKRVNTVDEVNRAN